VSGGGSFCSGCDNAQWQFLGGMIPQVGRPPQPGFFLLRTADIVIDDDWHTMGLAGTGSKSIVAQRAFVPTHRAVTFAALVDATAPGMRAHPNPLYKQSFLAVLPVTIVAPVIGMAEGALEPFSTTQRSASRAAPSRAGGGRWPISPPCSCASPRRPPASMRRG
jgi:3-hydroxy-9,10-secoandrosta-1,3,5(10)-triene-9,17-dione monooxygenase